MTNENKLLIQPTMTSGGLKPKTYPSDGGYDMFVAQTTLLKPHALTFVPAGFRMKIPVGTAALVIGRSSAAASGLLVVTGLIDEGYTGDMFTLVYNMNDEEKMVKEGDRISQIIILPNQSLQHETEWVKSLPDTPRGTKGFGSSGGGI